MSTFREWIWPSRKSKKDLKVEVTEPADETKQGDETKGSNEASPGMERTGSLSSLWQWATSPFVSPAPSREGSMHGGKAFARKESSNSLTSSLWARFGSPAQSRENSLRGGNAFGAETPAKQRKKSDLIEGIWQWVTPSRENSAHGGSAFAKAKQPASPDSSTFQSAMSPMPSRPAEPTEAPVNSWLATKFERGV